MGRMSKWFPAILLCAVILIGCGSDEDSSKATVRAEATTTEPDEPGPNVPIPEGPPPKRLVIRDVERGTGKSAGPGDEVKVLYVGRNWTGNRYSNAYTYNEPPSLVLGKGQLEQGFERGVYGMKAGGVRIVIVPPRLIARRGIKPTTLDPSATVVFHIKLLRVYDPPRF
jgi:FKBP-type peptidyl-prolyl cis-trans isomerase